MNRRELVKLAAAPFVCARGAQDSPNVLFVICDQMRADALGMSGNPNARTPHLDALAREGVQFSRCTSANPVCVPSRKSMFTGLYPQHHGSLTNDHDKYLPLEGSMIDYFRGKGYKTGYFGKNHTFRKEAIAQVDVPDVRDREKFRAYDPQVTPWWHASAPWPEEKCHPHLNTEGALRFLKGVKSGERFFVTVSYFDPHPPYFAPPRHIAKINPDSLQIPQTPLPGALSPRLEEHSRAMGFEKMTDAGIRETMQHYHAAVDWGVDEQVGRLMAGLRETGHDRNTIVVMVSDHGDFMGNYHMVRKGMFLQEALLHVPMIWWGPGYIAKNVRSAAPVQTLDIFPTLVELTGGKRPARMDGIPAVPVLRGASQGERKTVYASASYGEIDKVKLQQTTGQDALHTRVFDQEMVETNKTAMIREGEWKLIVSETRGPELYHLPGHGHETGNVAEQRSNAGVRRDLESKLRRWWSW